MFDFFFFRFGYYPRLKGLLSTVCVCLAGPLWVLRLFLHPNYLRQHEFDCEDIVDELNCEGAVVLDTNFGRSQRERLKTFWLNVGSKQGRGAVSSPFIKLDLRKYPNVIESFLLGLKDSEVLPIAKKYLGVRPVLGEIEIWNSPNDEVRAESSQLFHFDGQDNKELLYILPLTDIDEHSGPLVYCKPKESRQVVERTVGPFSSMKSKRFTDSSVFAVLREMHSMDSVQAITSSRGDEFLFDGDRCLHYGSRLADKPRVMFVAHFYRPSAFTRKWWRPDRDTCYPPEVKFLRGFF